MYKTSTYSNNTGYSKNVISFYYYLFGKRKTKRILQTTKYQYGTDNCPACRSGHQSSAFNAEIIDIGEILDKKLNDLIEEILEEEWRLHPTDIQYINVISSLCHIRNIKLKMDQLRTLQEYKQTYL